MNKDLVAIFEYLEREKGIKREIVISAIEESLCAAARKSVDGMANATAKINPKTGDIQVFCEKEIVQDVEQPACEIALDAAREFDPDCELGQFIDVPVTPKNFGRIAAQTARQVIAQKLRGAERDVIYEEYRHRLNEIVSGSVKRFRGPNLIIDMGKVEAILPARQYPRLEEYQLGDKINALLLEVRDLDNGGAEVVLSRSHPEFVRQLFAQEVPEVHDGIVLIEKIARDAGYRTKMLVSSSDSRVDPVGACVGVRGTRVKNIIRELNNEKIDIIPYTANPIEQLQNILSPIEIRKINEGPTTITIIVEDADFANVIGKRHMNAKLTGELLGKTLEVRKISDYTQGLTIQRQALIEFQDAVLDQPLKLDGLNTLILENILHAGYDTPRRLLAVPPEDLAKIPGVNLDLAYRLTEQVIGGLAYLLDDESTEEDDEESEPNDE